MTSERRCTLMFRVLLCFVLGVWGGVSGGFLVDNTRHVTGNTAVAKLQPGFVCYKTLSTDTSFSVAVKMFEADQTFVDADKTTTTRIRYETCRFISTSAYIQTPGPMRVVQPSCDLAKVDAAAASTTIENNLWEHLITNVPETPGTVPCGGVANGDDYTWTIHCQRNLGFDSYHDATFLFKCDKTDLMILTQDSAAVSVLGPSINVVSRSWDLTFEAFKLDPSPATIPSPNPRITSSNSGVTSPSVYMLGDTIFFQICLATSSTAFFEDGLTPIGVNIHSCVVSVPSADVLAGVTSTATISDANGCGSAVLPFLEASSNEDFFLYKDDGLSSTQDDKLRSPNCWLTKGHEVVSIARKGRNTNIQMTMTCQIDYCTSSTAASCFTDTCPVAGRRRRQDDTSAIETNTETISTTITILNEYPSVPVTQEGCFEQMTFIGLVVALVILLLLVLSICMFLAMRIRALSYSDRSSSVTGFSNKGFH